MESGDTASEFRLVDEVIMREEVVVQALGGLKRRVSADKDGLTVGGFGISFASVRHG